MLANCYLATVIISALLLFGIVYLTRGRDSRFYILLYVSIVISNYAYYSLIVSPDLSSALSATKLSYLNGTFCTMFLLYCIMQICNIKIKFWFSSLLTLLSSIVFGMVMTIGNSKLFYVSASYKNENGISYIIKEYGPLHNCYTILVFLYMLLPIGIIIYAFFHQNKASYKYTTMLALVEIISIIIYFTERAIHLHNELMPFANTISLICILLIAHRIAKYDVSARSMIQTVGANNYGYILFDLDELYIGCDSLAAKLFPELNDLYIDQKVNNPHIKELFIFWIHEYQNNTQEEKIFEIDNKSYSCSLSIYNNAFNNKALGYIIEIFDVTERQKHIKELDAINLALADAVKKAEAASQAKSAFLANMSHEIRTPLNAILGLNEIIIRESSDENIEKYATDAKRSGQILLSLINDILDLSKIESGKMEIVNVNYEINNIINDLNNMITPRAEEKNLDFSISIDDSMPSVLWGDEIRIKQIIINILTNAVKYTHKGSVTLSVRYETIDEDNILVKVSVKDTGIGMKAESIDKLFAPFERIEEKRNRNIEGTGLGMNITRRLLILMNSDLQVSSIYGEGSEFSFAIKQKVVSQESISASKNRLKDSSAAKKYSASFVAPNAKVLIVDDININLIVCQQLLKSTQVQIDTATSGKDAIEKCKNNKYDIVLLDHMMPEMDGIETLHAIKALDNCPNTDTPFIALTANASSGIREEYISYGFNDYIAKPVEPGNLEKILSSYLKTND